MKTTVALLVMAALCSTAYALYSVNDSGTWPKTWPAELEPLRKQARTLEGPLVAQQHHAIRFSKRQEFENAWPHLLKVKSKGTPIILVRGPNFFLGDDLAAGVIVHAPPRGQADNPAAPEGPIAGVANVRERWMNTTYIELVIDGEIVDLNRIALPPDTPIVDKRFDDAQNK